LGESPAPRRRLTRPEGAPFPRQDIEDRDVTRRLPDPRSAYVHVPFCAHRCGYCDFTLVAGRDELIDEYLQALTIDLRQLEQPRLIDTLFLGGGTPTHLSRPQLSRLVELLRSWFWLADGFEFSVEANPMGLGDDKIDVLADAGVNRVSLGVQSFDDGILRFLERDHRRADVLQAVERLRRRIENVSIDLIFGVPGQSLELWRQTLREAISLGPKHVSTYGLTFERGTPFYSRLQREEFAPVNEEQEREMYSAAMDDLAAAGFEQYEISNFALSGFRCRHNEVYWKGLPFFGFGPGAASYVDGRRALNHRSVLTWLKRVSSGKSPIMETEELTGEDRAREAIVLGLRRREGIQKDEFAALTGYEIGSLAGETISRYSELGLLEEVDSHLRLTREGRFLADAVFVDFL